MDDEPSGISWWIFFFFFSGEGLWDYRRPIFLWKGLQVRRREGTGQRESKAQPAQASTSTTKAQTQE